MPTLTAYVANCLISGGEITHHADGSWIRDVVRFKCDGSEFIFRQQPDIAYGKTEHMIGAACATSTVVVENVSVHSVAKVLKAIDAICWLLSFACQSRVMCYGHDFPNGSRTGHYTSVVGVANYFRPALDLHDSNMVRSFVEQAYPKYKQLFRKRKLTAVFDYLVQADRASQPLEIRILLLFITLESLKDTYARENSFPHIKGFYRKGLGKSGKAGAAYTFEELLKQMLCSVGMRRGLRQVVALRNEIIHTGLSRKRHAAQWRMYERVQDILREYIFRLLAYRGDFVTYSNQGMGRKVI